MSCLEIALCWQIATRWSSEFTFQCPFLCHSVKKKRLWHLPAYQVHTIGLVKPYWHKTNSLAVKLEAVLSSLFFTGWLSRYPSTSPDLWTRSGVEPRGTMVGKPDWGREGAAPSGQVRVLVLGDAGVGKTSLVHLIVNETRIKNPQRTVGCAVEVKHLVYREPTTSSYIQKYRDRDFFVELWDISGHQQYKNCRSIFYSQINGVIFVHDLSQRKTKANLQGWASEIASQGSFSAPLPNVYTSSLPVPSLVIGNKSDIAPPMGSSSNLVDAARQWVEKQGLLSPSDELPTTQKFPGGRDLHAAAKDGDLDLDAVRRFFVSLIQRKYYPEEFMSTTPQRTWDGLQSTRSTGANSYHTKGFSFDDQLLSSSSSFGGDSAYSTPWSREERLSPPTSPSPEKPLSQADFRAFKLGPVQSLTRSNSGTSRIDIHV